MASFRPVQSVHRAFVLLKELNKQPISTVSNLHKRTGLPKSTIVRLLKTLTLDGFVTSDDRLGGYQVTSQVEALSSGFHGSPMVIEAARPWAVELTRKLKWPIGISVLEKDAMFIRFSTTPDSPISPFHTTLNMRLSLVTRAMGRAYIAFCPPDERELLLRMLEKSHHPEDRLSELRARVRWLVKSIRARGFAERDPKAEPVASATVAVPVMLGGRVLATLGVGYFRSAVPRSKLLAQIVRPLQEMQQQVEASIRGMRTS